MKKRKRQTAEIKLVDVELFVLDALQKEGDSFVSDRII